jgi:hypothetical protein
VPELRPVRSRITPEGTATEDKMIVEQDVLDLLADEAPPDPEKVQVVALFSISGPAVGSGAAAGAARAREAAPAMTPAIKTVKRTIL